MINSREFGSKMKLNWIITNLINRLHRKYWKDAKSQSIPQRPNSHLKQTKQPTLLINEQILKKTEIPMHWSRLNKCYKKQTNYLKSLNHQKIQISQKCKKFTANDRNGGNSTVLVNGSFLRCLVNSLLWCL
jgi:hypothetical protein